MGANFLNLMTAYLGNSIRGNTFLISEGDMVKTTSTINRLSTVVDLRIPGFMKTVPVGSVGQTTFRERHSGEWFQEFSEKCINSINRKFFPVLRMSDGEFYFWYANDMNILRQIPTEYNSHNNLWSVILSVFFAVNPSTDILEYMNLQRLLSVIISTLTVFPMFFLCKKFFSNNYALVGAAFFVFDPRIIINSLLGITEPIYFLVGILIILFALNKNKKLWYLAFGFAAIFSLIRYEGLIILVPLTITYFWRFKLNKKSILKYGLCILIFVLVLLPMIEARIQATGQDGLTSHIFSGANYVSNTLSGTYEKQDRTEFFKDGVFNSLMYLGWITIPIWIVFLPYGIWKYFKKLDFQKNSLLLFSIVMILPAIYAYSRDIPETRYLYMLFPLFSIMSLFRGKIKK